MLPSFTDEGPVTAMLDNVTGAALNDTCAGSPPRRRIRISTLTAEAWYDGSAFASATGFRPEVDLAEGMRLTVQWMRENPA